MPCLLERKNTPHRRHIDTIKSIYSRLSVSVYLALILFLTCFIYALMLF